MTERIWDKFLTEQDKASLGLRPHSGRGFGKKPALILVDVYRGVFGDHPQPLFEAMKTWPGSCGKRTRNSPSRTVTDWSPVTVRIVSWDVVLGIGMKFRRAHSALIIVYIDPVSTRKSETGIRMPARASISTSRLARKVVRIGPKGSESMTLTENGTRKEEIGRHLRRDQ